MKIFRLTVLCFGIFSFVVGLSRISMGRDCQARVEKKPKVSKGLPEGIRFLQTGIVKCTGSSQDKGLATFRNKGGGDVIFFDDFDGGGVPEPEPIWTTKDLNVMPPTFHRSHFEALSGNRSWWVGDTVSLSPLREGYLSDWYQVLDTRVIDLSGAAAPCSLFFLHKYNVENPSGASPPYDGWDGLNVRISTDGGSTFEVLDTPQPAYTRSSLASFGGKHCEGPGIPGWCGSGTAPHRVSIDLSDYVSQGSVVVRFALASDWAYDVMDNSELFGWILDDISLEGMVGGSWTQIFFDDGGDASPDGQMIPRNNHAGLGDLWVKTEEAYHSSAHSWNCEDDNFSMNDALITPPIVLPTGYSSLYFTYYTYPDLPDGDGDGDGALEDYWYIDISTDSGATWNEFCYDHYRGEAGFVEKTSGLMMPGPNDVPLDLTPYAGDTIMLRWRLTTDCNNDGGNGEGLYIDDVGVYGVSNLPRPTGLKVDSTDCSGGDCFVDLSWDVGGEYAYDDGGFETGYAANRGGVVYWATKMYFPEGVREVKTVRLYCTQPDTIVVCGWEDDGANGMPGDSVLCRPSGVVPHDTGWTDVDVSGLGWEFDGSFYVGYLQTKDRKPFCGLDITDPDDNRSVVYLGDFGWYTWTQVAQKSNGEYPEGNFGIRAVVGPISELQGYKVYRWEEGGDANVLGLIEDPEESAYSDNSAVMGKTYWYAISALYQGGESDLSDSVQILVMPPSAYEIVYDDSIMDYGFNVGANNGLAVRFTPPFYPAQVIALEYYVNGSGYILAKVWGDSDGVPGQEIYSEGIHNIKPGWNLTTKIIPHSVIVDSGDFFVGWIELPMVNPPIGLDSTHPIDDRSWYYFPDEGWSKFSDVGLKYDLMIRVYVNSPSGQGMGGIPEEVEVGGKPIRYSLSQNYPNPFNPKTEIRYSLSKPGLTYLRIFNTLGQEVVTLMDEEQEAGMYRVVWEGKDEYGNPVGSGIYFCRMKSGDYTATRKMVLIR